MKQSFKSRDTIPIVIATSVVLAGFCMFLLAQQFPANAADGRFDRALVPETQALMAALHSDETTIRDLKKQLQFLAENRRLSAGNTKTGDLDPNLYPAFRSLPDYRYVPMKPNGAFHSRVSSKNDAAVAHDQISGVQKTLLSPELKPGGTRDDVQSLRHDVDSHIRDLSARLAALAARDERKYIYFDIHKQKTPTQLHDIQLVLKKTDPKHNRFTCDLIANHMTIREKDKSLLEPIQIYLENYKLPYEMVVRSINHDEIVGYLSVPAR